MPDPLTNDQKLQVLLLAQKMQITGISGSVPEIYKDLIDALEVGKPKEFGLTTYYLILKNLDHAHKTLTSATSLSDERLKLGIAFLKEGIESMKTLCKFLGVDIETI